MTRPISTCGGSVGSPAPGCFTRRRGGLDLESKQVLFDARPPLAFDLLSIDIGSTPATNHIDGAAAHAIPIKPVDAFRTRWAELEENPTLRMADGEAVTIVIVGAGAGGVEVSLCLQHRLKQKSSGQAKFIVLTDTEAPVANHSPAVQNVMRETMAARGIDFRIRTPVTEIRDGAVVTASDEVIAANAILLLSHAGAASWLAETGLALDDHGFIAVNRALQSTSHDFVFATGDIAAFTPVPLPKSGVYAVREGPVLADNLRRKLAGRPLKPYKPQPRTLALITTGDKNAVASYAGYAAVGGWVWRWKDWIDRRWMKQYQDLPEMPDDAADPMRCGGCGAKVANNVLRQALARFATTAGRRLVDRIGRAGRCRRAAARTRPGTRANRRQFPTLHRRPLPVRAHHRQSLPGRPLCHGRDTPFGARQHRPAFRAGGQGGGGPAPGHDRPAGRP